MTQRSSLFSPAETPAFSAEKSAASSVVWSREVSSREVQQNAVQETKPEIKIDAMRERRGSRARAFLGRTRSRGRDSQMPRDLPRATPEAQPPDAELIVAVFRTIVILAALFAPRIASFLNPEIALADGFDVPQVWLAAFAGAYNFAVIVGYARQGRRALRRPFIIAMDATLITLWIQLSFEWRIFPLYYVVVVIAAVWYRTWGGLLTAACCNFFFLLILGRSAAYTSQASQQLVPAPPIDLFAAFRALSHSPFLANGLALDVAMLFMVASLVGSLAQAQERERVRRLEEQLLLASYQREIDLASQLQPLLMSQFSTPPETDEANAEENTENATSNAQSSTRLQTQWTMQGQIEAPARVPLSESLKGASRRAREDDASQARLQNSDLRLGAAMQPARAFGGGDYFDLLPLPGGRSALCIADVSGKSVRAQARLPLLKYALRALAPLHNEADTLVKRLNETLSPDLQGEIYIGLCVVILDPRANKLSWCNAGHIAPLLLPLRPYDERGRAVPEMIALETSGPALGLFPEANYKANSAMWRPGDRLLLFTDGLSDALSYNGAEDGEEQVRFVSQELDHESWREPQQIAQHFLALALEAMENTETLWSKLSPLRRGDDPVVKTPSRHRDDMTVIAARRLLPNEN